MRGSHRQKTFFCNIRRGVEFVAFSVCCAVSAVLMSFVVMAVAATFLAIKGAF